MHSQGIVRKVGSSVRTYAQQITPIVHSSLKTEVFFISFLPYTTSRVARGCSGLMKPDTLLGENARQIEVSDDQTTPYLFR